MARRRGTVQRRGDRFVIGVSVTNPMTGERRRLYRTVEGPKRNAEAELAKWLVDVDNEELIEPSTITVEQWAHQWLAMLETEGLAGRTVMTYRRHILKRLVPRMGSMRLQQVKAMHLSKFFVELAQPEARNDVRPGPLSARTRASMYLSINRLFRAAEDLELIRHNPMRKVPKPRAREVPRSTLSTQEVAKILEGSKGHWCETFVILAVATGARRGELLALRWSDIDFERGEARIVRATDDSGPVTTFKTPKTARGMRTILLPQFAVAALKRHRKQQLEDRMLLGPEYRDQDLVFAKHSGDPYRPSTITSAVRELTASIPGVPTVGPHEFRHHVATQLLRHDIPVHDAAARLGHDPAILLRQYAHAVPTDQVRAAAALDQLYGN